MVLDGATRRGPDQSKDIDFSITALAERWSAGQADIKRALHHKSWVKPLPPHVGTVLHEFVHGETSPVRLSVDSPAAS
ncbi:DUF3734 domain-containing protein [Undibacterium arcticum]|uniref:DUF3734 domain-containing protein n=1 Tax=Undibacterium arcticum TaxID=1762892 RepID=UPI003AA869F3